IEGFIYWFTHCSHPSDGDDPNFKVVQEWTPEQMYQGAIDYISEDHVDGKDTNEEYCIDLWLEAEEANRNEDTGKALELKNKFREKYVTLTKRERKYVKRYLDSVGG